MSSAFCKCDNGHTFNSAILDDDWDTNSVILGDEDCPECGADFAMVDYNPDEPDWPDGIP